MIGNNQNYQCMIGFLLYLAEHSSNRDIQQIACLPANTVAEIAKRMFEDMEIADNKDQFSVSFNTVKVKQILKRELEISTLINIGASKEVIRLLTGTSREGLIKRRKSISGVSEHQLTAGRPRELDLDEIDHVKNLYGTSTGDEINRLIAVTKKTGYPFNSVFKAITNSSGSDRCLASGQGS